MKYILCRLLRLHVWRYHGDPDNPDRRRCFLCGRAERRVWSWWIERSPQQKETTQ